MKIAKTPQTNINASSFLTIFEQSPISTQIFTPDGTSIAANKAWEKLWGAKHELIAGRYNVLKDQQLLEKGTMKYLKRGFKGEIVEIPAIKYEPPKTVKIKGVVPYRYVKALIYPVKDTNGKIINVILQHEDITEQKNAEMDLLKSETLFKTLTNHVPVGIFLTDKKGDCQFVNKRWCQLAGLTFEEAKGKGWLRALYSEDKKRVFKEWYNAAKNNKDFFSVYRFQTPQGKISWVSGNATALHDNDGKVSGYLGSVTDVTDRKLTEDALKESEEEAREVSNLLSTIINSAPVGFCLFDKDLRYLMINSVLADINGVAPEKHINKTIHEIIPSLEKSATIELRKVLKTGKPVLNLELSGETKSEPGKIKHWKEDYFPVRSTRGKIIGLGAIVIDITARKEAEKRLKDNETRLQLALDAGSIGVWDWDIKSNKVRWSDKVYEIHGLKKSDFDNEFVTYVQRIYPEDKTRVERAINRALQNKAPYDIEFRIVTAKNEIKWVATSAKVIFEKGKAVRMLGATIDVTKRKYLENQKNEFIAIASHELKTPVTSIKSFGQVLRLRFEREGNKKAAELLGKMDSQVNKLTNLISDLLDVTKIETGRIQLSISRFSFDELVQELVEEMQRTTEKHKIFLKGTTGKKIYGDRERIGQVITNLITNAIKYSPHSEKIIVHLLADSKNVQLCVQDFGVGIPPEKKDKVFERFFRVTGPGKETYPGLGLGLYISSEIIKRQGGRIWVESKMGKGSKFFFTLPIRKLDLKRGKNRLIEEEVKHE